MLVSVEMPAEMAGAGAAVAPVENGNRINQRFLSRAQVKSKYSHNIMALYEALGHGAKVLSTHESDVLLKASNVYRGKGFEYFSPDFALEGYKSFPDLRVLEDVARKLMARCEEEDLS